MGHQHLENLLIRYRNQMVTIKTMSGQVYDGTIADVTNDYVALKCNPNQDLVIVLLHSIESISPR